MLQRLCTRRAEWRERMIFLIRASTEPEPLLLSDQVIIWSLLFLFLIESLVWVLDDEYDCKFLQRTPYPSQGVNLW